jgi:hypothetical protein
MNEHDFDLAARAWLDDGPNRMSDRAVLSALEQIHLTRQRRPVWPAWRPIPMNTFARMVSAAVLVVAVGVLAITVLPPRPDGSSVGGSPTSLATATASATPSPSPSAVQHDGIKIEFRTTFVSPINGYSFKYLDRGGLIPAKVRWDPLTQPRPDHSGAYDDPFDLVETGLAAVTKSASTVLPDGVTIDAWVDEHVTGNGCGLPRSQQAEITIDGQSGRFFQCPDEIDATVVDGGRLYLFILMSTRTDARAVFDDWIATIHLTPETAAVPSSTPS